MPLDNPEYARAAGVLKDVLPEGVDPMSVWTALQAAGLTITESSTPPTEADGEAMVPEGTAPDGAPVDGEPKLPGGVEAEGLPPALSGPPTEDLAREAVKRALAGGK